MQQTNIQEQTIVKANPHYQNCPVDFIETTTLALCQLNDSAALEAQLEELLSEDALEMMQENADLFLVLSYVLSNTIRRVVFTPKEIRFPNLLLLLPPIYQSLSWCHKGNEEWDAFHDETLARFEMTPRLDEAVMLLFLEGMKFSLYDAILMFQSRAALLGGMETQNAQQLAQELTEYGWPAVEMRYSA